MREEKLDFYSKTNLKSYNLDDPMRYQLSMLDSLDAFTRKHSENVANLTCRICEYMNASTKFTIYCTTSAYLHDIGKQFIPARILQKKEMLTNEEFEIMKTHTTIGQNMCMKDLKLRPYVAGPLYHHEALDGSGYPNGLTKKDIPIEGQIIRIADEYDAIVSKRQYKSHIDISEALNILIEETRPTLPNAKVGKINPKILKALLKVVIDDIEYEKYCVAKYVEYLDENIARLQEMNKYLTKMKEAKSDKQKTYYENGVKVLLQPGENLQNCPIILDEYLDAKQTRTDILTKLDSEIKKVKKMKF